MSFKDLSYFLKGGIIGLIIAISLFVISIIFLKVLNPQIENVGAALIFYMSVLLLFILPILGLIIGFIIGKLNSK